jgi:hypothetical protein
MVGTYGWSPAFEDVRKLRSKYDQLVEENRFISCSERLPDKTGGYLVVGGMGVVFRAHWLSNTQEWIKEADHVGWDISHWRSWPRFVPTCIEPVG